MAEAAPTLFDATDAVERNHEDAIAPVIAEIAAGLRARTLKKVEIVGTNEDIDLPTQLATTLQDSAIDPTVIREISITEVKLGPVGIVTLETAFRSATAITSFGLTSNAIGDEGAILLASALQSASGLQFLILRNNGIGDTGAIAIANSFEWWQSLMGFTISRNEIGYAGAKALGEAIGKHPTFDVLSIRENPLKDKGVAALCVGMKQRKSVSALFLGNCQFTSACFRDLGDANVPRLWLAKNDFSEDGSLGAFSLLVSRCVTHIVLNCCGLGPIDASIIAEALGSNNVLTSLVMTTNCVMDEGAAAMANSLRRNTGLRTIDLSENHIGDIGAVAIGAALEQNTTLHELTLTQNQIGTVGCKAFVQYLRDRQTLFHLSLANNPISESDRRILFQTFRERAEQGIVVNVDVLDEDTESTGDTAATTIAEAIKVTRENSVMAVSILDPNITFVSWTRLMEALEISTSVQEFRLRHPSAPGRVSNMYERLADVLKRNSVLTTFDLQTVPQSVHRSTENPVSSQSFFYPTADSIVESLRFNTTLKRLMLNKCSITSKRAALLADALRHNPSPSVQVLELMNNDIDDDGAVALATMLRINDSIEELALSANSIGDIGATALGDSLMVNRKTSTLDFRKNRIGDSGAAALATATTVNHAIKVLQMDNNRVGDRGATVIANALDHNTSLVVLSLGTNSIGDIGCEALAKQIGNAKQLRTLRLAGNVITAVGAAALFSALSRSKKCKLETLSLVHNSITTIGVEFLNTQSLTTVSLNYADLAWPPPSVSSRATPTDRSSVYRFLESTAASSNLLVRSRLMLVGHGGVGKTTLKTALLMSSDRSAIATLRDSILEIIRTKWTEADIQSWVDVDLADRPNFFIDHCPGAIGITGARWLEYTQSDLIAVFGVSETETARVVVRKMAEVLCFLLPQQASQALSSVPTETSSDADTGWGWISNVVIKALERSAPHFGDFVGVDHPLRAPSDVLEMSPVSAHQRYDALLNLPHVWTEGIELECWDDANYTVWDLPGQMELYPSHRMFSASATAVYVLVVNGGRGFDECSAKLSRWLCSLRIGFRFWKNEVKVPVRLVLSHTDALTELERASLQRELLDLAVLRFGEDFDFGSHCFATLYGEAGGGDPSTGVDALRTELLQLRSAGVERHPLPTTYQRACDDVVAISRTNEMSRWPIVSMDVFPTYDQPVDDIVGCLEDLGFVRRVRSRIILEPVTWLSRLMAAFLHPFHGIGRAIAKSSDVTSLTEHIAAATITSAAASRIVNQRGRIVQAENEGDVLEILSSFDVCFQLRGTDRFVFPMLLPLVATRLPWLEKSFRSHLRHAPNSARRYTCFNAGDAIPPTLTALLMEAALGIDDWRPVYLGRCTLIAFSTVLKSYIGLHQSTDESTIDLFAAGNEHQRLLGVLTLNLAVLATKHYPRLRIQQHLLWIAKPRNNPLLQDVTTDEVNHVLLGPCFSQCSHILSVEDTQLELAVRQVPTWQWQLLDASMMKHVSANVADAEHDTIVFASWKSSRLRQTLLRHSRPLCLWIDTYYLMVDDSGDTTPPLRGRQLLVDVFSAEVFPEDRTSDSVDITERSVTPAQNRDEPDGLPPHMCGISFETLKAVYDQAAALAGADFETWTMRDLNQAIVKPLCTQHGTSLALVHSPDGLAADVFVSHAWGESFKHFAESVMETYRTSVRKPTLWICTFALVQSDDPVVVARQIGPADAPLGDAPFARAMQHVREILVVRNATVDIYSRLWCVCEVYFAHTFGLAPDHTKVVGSDAFAGVITSCLDAKCRDLGDRIRILHALIGGSTANAELVNRIDRMILEFRRFAGDADHCGGEPL